MDLLDEDASFADDSYTQFEYEDPRKESTAPSYGFRDDESEDPVEGDPVSHQTQQCPSPNRHQRQREPAWYRDTPSHARRRGSTDEPAATAQEHGEPLQTASGAHDDPRFRFQPFGNTPQSSSQQRPSPRHVHLPSAALMPSQRIHQQMVPEVQRVAQPQEGPPTQRGGEDNTALTTTEITAAPTRYKIKNSNEVSEGAGWGRPAQEQGAHTTADHNSKAEAPEGSMQPYQPNGLHRARLHAHHRQSAEDDGSQQPLQQHVDPSTAPSLPARWKAEEASVTRLREAPASNGGNVLNMSTESKTAAQSTTPVRAALFKQQGSPHTFAEPIAPPQQRIATTSLGTQTEDQTLPVGTVVGRRQQSSLMQELERRVLQSETQVQQMVNELATVAQERDALRKEVQLLRKTNASAASVNPPPPASSDAVREERLSPPLVAPPQSFHRQQQFSPKQSSPAVAETSFPDSTLREQLLDERMKNEELKRVHERDAAIAQASALRQQQRLEELEQTVASLRNQEHQEKQHPTQPDSDNIVPPPLPHRPLGNSRPLSPQAEIGAGYISIETLTQLSQLLNSQRVQSDPRQQTERRNTFVAKPLAHQYAPRSGIDEEGDEDAPLRPLGSVQDHAGSGAERRPMSSMKSEQPQNLVAHPVRSSAGGWHGNTTTGRLSNDENHGSTEAAEEPPLEQPPPLVQSRRRTLSPRSNGETVTAILSQQQPSHQAREHPRNHRQGTRNPNEPSNSDLPRGGSLDEVMVLEERLLKYNRERDDTEVAFRRVEFAKVRSLAEKAKRDALERQLGMLNGNISDVRRRLRQLSALQR